MCYTEAPPFVSVQAVLVKKKFIICTSRVPAEGKIISVCDVLEIYNNNIN